MKRALFYSLLAVIFTITSLFAQMERRDKAIFVTPSNKFIDSVETALKLFREKPAEPRKELRTDFSRFEAPVSVREFKQIWHTPPIAQAISGMCWSFAATSFLESEIYRLYQKEMKFSELFTVYHEYLEKAARFVRERGNSAFGEGSQVNAVYRSWKKNGIVPLTSYTGLLNGQPFHDHTAMFTEMRSFLFGLKASGAWSEESALAAIRSIMQKHIGHPPQSFVLEGKPITPKEYYEKVVRLNVDDYIGVCSFNDRPFYTWVEFNVPDNWWHSEEYFNIPLDEYMAIIKRLVRSGISVPIWGDVSEPGIEGEAGIAVIPTFDIPSAFIDEHARQFRFNNGTTTDDHGVHIVGYLEKNGKDWYLVKDSGSGARNNSHPGYYFYHEDFVKLKMLGFGVRKDAIPELAAKMKK